MDCVAVTARTSKLPDPAAPCARPTNSAETGFWSHVCGHAQIHHAGWRRQIQSDHSNGYAYANGVCHHVHVHVHGYGFGGDASARSIAHQDIGSANWRLVPAEPVSDRLKLAPLTAEPRKAPKAQCHGQRPSKAPVGLIHACRPDGSTWPKRRQYDLYPWHLSCPKQTK